MVKQFLQFLENEDASTITLKKFNDSTGNKYPTFSVCLTLERSSMDNIEIIKNFYQEDLINETLGIDVLVYYEMLLGNLNMDTGAKAVGMANFSSLEFDRAKRNMVKFIHYERTSFKGESL